MTQFDDERLSQIVRTVRYWIDQEPHVPGSALSPEEIRRHVDRAVPLFVANAAELADYRYEATRHVSAGMRVQIAPVHSIQGEKRVDWYFGARLENRTFWERYRRYLAYEQTHDATTIASIDRCSDRIVSLMGDPATTDPFDRRGLVVGQVQSGKTTSYAAVINKCIDAGYRIIIVLSGIQEGLRVQTQKRIEETVRGLSTETRNGGGRDRDRELPLSGIRAVPNPPQLLTTRSFGGDFAKDARHYATAADRTVVFVVKKNVKVLQHVRSFLRNAEAFQRVRDAESGRDEIVDRPALVIDDEADNASVDTRRPDHSDKDHDPSAVNREIRKLLLLFRQRAYVGYTATPYANILIHKDNEAKDVGPDLFPRDFIVMLPSPSNYVGPSTFFGGSHSEAEADAPPLLRSVTDCGITVTEEDWMPLGHDKHHVPRYQGKNALPESLEDAVMVFLIAAALRGIRGKPKAHNSMLVHVSRFKSVQKRVSGQIDQFRYELKGEFDGISNSRQLVERLRQLYADDLLVTASKMKPDDAGPFADVSTVVDCVRQILDRIEIRVVNSESDTDLDYDEHPDGLTVICVGGDKLSRGLTLEGLSVSFFLRATRMYDTLMQMGRWFGYRPGYKDLCRLFLTDELQTWYEHISRADEELRAEFLELEAINSRPLDFGLRVRSHPSIQVTAPAKMSAAEELDLDFGGRVTQTLMFHRDRAQRAENHGIVRNFLDSIEDMRSKGDDGPVRRNPKTGASAPNQPLPGALYHQVPIEALRKFLAAFTFHPEARRVSGPRLLEYLEHAARVRSLSTWSVLVASAGTLSDDSVSLTDSIRVIPVRRATKPQAPLDCSGPSDAALTIGVLSSPVDLIADFRPDEVDRFTKLPSGAAVPENSAEGERVQRNNACIARSTDHGLLVIYVVRPTTRIHREHKEKGASPVILEEGALPPIGLALALPRDSKVPRVKYLANSVYLDALEAQYAASEIMEFDPELQ